MTDQPANQPDPARAAATSAATSAGPSSKYDTVPTLRATGTRKCPSCDAGVPAHASVCPECGDSLQTKPKMVRCRRCGNSATSELVVCPYCGRELQPAPPRLLTWGGPFVIVGLFFLLLFSRWNGENPIAWAQLQLSGSFARVGDLGDGIEPGAVAVMTPIPGNSEVVAAVDEMAGEELGVPENPVAFEVGEGDSMQESLPPDGVDSAEGDSVNQAGSVAMLAATTTELPSPTAVPTANSSAIISTVVAPPPAPEDLPTGAPTVTQASGVSSLDKVVPAVKALSLNLPTATPIVAVTKESKPTALPTATSTPTPEPSFTPTQVPTPTVQQDATASSESVPGRQTYKIRDGDTLLGISTRFDVEVEALMLVNNIAPNGAYTIQPGQTIVIPAPGEEVKSPPTPTSTATSTPAPTKPPKPTVTPTAIESRIRLDAPILRSPEDGTPASCSAPTSLVWLAVPYVKAEDKYILHLGFVSGRNEDNSEIVTWVLAQPRPANVTSWDMDGNLCGLAPQDFGRQWRWWVEVAEDAGDESVPVSPPSKIWGFSWN